MKTPRRVARALRQPGPRGVFLHYSHAYRQAAREQGVDRIGRYQWLTRPNRGTGAGGGLLAWSGNRAPVDAHDAALRVLAEWAPGIARMDPLELRAEVVRVYAARGLRAPYIRLHHK